MKHITFLFVSLFSVFLHAQEERSMKMGQTSMAELQMTSYEKDPSAPAVVLYDEISYYFSNYKKKIFNRDIYSRVKILSTDGLQEGTRIFTLSKDIDVLEITGITYNLNEQNEIIKTNFDPTTLIKDNVDESRVKVIINFPNVKEGSVVEFKFRVAVEGGSYIDDWYFQTDIPTVKSKLMRLTPKTMDYIVNLTGSIPLTRKEAKDNIKCYTKKRSSLKCRFASYEMENVPAFKKEPYMPSRSTLISKLDFRFSYFLERGYRIYRMTTKWSQFDSLMRRYYFDQQITKKSFLGNIVPDSLYKTGPRLQAAKNIFHFIQDHYSWNGNVGGDTQINIRKNFKNRTASVSLIAETLYNSLQAASIECYYVVASSNNRGPIDWKIPSRSDFDFTVIKAVIDGKSYFLDATDKSIGFGYVQPFVNVKDGRVITNKVVGTNAKGYPIYQGSYRETMKPIQAPSKVVNAQWEFSKEKGFYGRTHIKYAGYEALLFRREIKEIGKKGRQDQLQQNFIDNDLINYEIKNLEDRDERVEEHITFELAEDEVKELAGSTSIRFTPVEVHLFSTNPFKEDERKHPIDFKFPRNFKFRFTFNIPEGYDVVNLPKNARFLFPNKGGSYLYQIQKSAGKVRIFINLKMLRSYYEVEQYQELKKLFTDILTLENSTIQLVKL
jgi:hypothetical protein